VGTPEDVAAVAVALETQDASLIIEEQLYMCPYVTLTLHMHD